MRVRLRILKYWGKLELAHNYLLIRWNTRLIFFSGLTGPQKLITIGIYIVANIIQELFIIQYNLNLYIKYVK